MATKTPKEPLCIECKAGQHARCDAPTVECWCVCIAEQNDEVQRWAERVEEEAVMTGELQI